MKNRNIILILLIFSLILMSACTGQVNDTPHITLGNEILDSNTPEISNNQAIDKNNPLVSQETFQIFRLCQEKLQYSNLIKLENDIKDKFNLDVSLKYISAEENLREQLKNQTGMVLFFKQ